LSPTKKFSLVDENCQKGKKQLFSLILIAVMLSYILISFFIPLALINFPFFSFKAMYFTLVCRVKGLLIKALPSIACTNFKTVLKSYYLNAKVLIYD